MFGVVGGTYNFRLKDRFSGSIVCCQHRQGAGTMSRSYLTGEVRHSRLGLVCRSEVSKTVFQQLTCASELLVSSCAGGVVIVGESGSK